MRPTPGYGVKPLRGKSIVSHTNLELRGENLTCFSVSLLTVSTATSRAAFQVFRVVGLADWDSLLE